MKKQEFKELYSFYRKARFNFNCYIERANLPCGADDSAYERFADQEQEFINNNPKLKIVLDIMDQTDTLEWRASDLSWYEQDLRAKYLLLNYRRSA